MTQEDKQLLLKDLCARLPYGVKVQLYSMDYPYGTVKTLDVSLFNDILHKIGDDVKPYLRPMSSMTKKEKEIYRVLCKKVIKDMYISDGRTQYGEKLYRRYDKSVKYYDTSEAIDFLNEFHFDYRGLIKKDLALKAKKGMYKTE